ncbi:MAG: hypothetical protein HKO59_07400 [Phycisphaerales bacterium]|nr:SRPBCC family protein [Phycisphaerae bacterium]NNF43018.1 hypothetical protein [Phycisphaerales bacterium]NNM25801.1 hypothetical protein [Phycisphaerales bacterium]
MGMITVRRRINAPAAEVFAAVSDFEHAADRITGIERVEMLTDGPTGVGTRFRETRIMMKREASEVMEVTAFEPGRSYTLEAASCGNLYRTTVGCEPVETGVTGVTDVVMEMTYTPQTFAAKCMSLAAPLLGGVMRKCLERDLDDLQADLEQSATPQPA